MDEYISIFVTAVGILIALVNVITEVLKKVITDDIFPTNALAICISEVLTVSAVLGYCSIYQQKIYWYIVAGAVICGILVAYGAMFGYDKLKEVLKR